MSPSMYHLNVKVLEKCEMNLERNNEVKNIRGKKEKSDEGGDGGLLLHNIS